MIQKKQAPFFRFFYCVAAAGFHRLSAVAGGCPSGLAVAPKVASAPRGPVPATLAGNPVQSLPRAEQWIWAIQFQGKSLVLPLNRILNIPAIKKEPVA